MAGAIEAIGLNCRAGDRLWPTTWRLLPGLVLASALSAGAASAAAHDPVRLVPFVLHGSVSYESVAEACAPAPVRTPQPPVRRPARRLLRMFGLTTRKELDRLQADHARLSDELQQAHRMLAENTAQPTSADPVKLAHRVNLLNGQLDRAKAEIAFRTRHWSRAAVGQGRAASLVRFGFDKLHLTPPAPVPDGPYHDKHYQERLAVSGLEAHRACWLELSCLNRLQELGGRIAARFPAPVALCAETPRLTMTHQGWSLDLVPEDLRERIAAKLRPRIACQSAEIAGALARAQVIHLDLHASGRNLTIDAEGQVSLIDFDIAALDEHPISAPIAQRLRRWRAAGGYGATRDQIAAQLDRFCTQAGMGNVTA